MHLNFVLVVESDLDLGGELAEDDFQNAKHPRFSRVSVGGEFNNDTEHTFEGDMITDLDGDDYDENYLNDVVNRADAKWPKINGHVVIPFTFPGTASKQDKADIAHVVNEFEEKTCVR